jgi:hypothetical protein
MLKAPQRKPEKQAGRRKTEGGKGSSHHWMKDSLNLLADGWRPFAFLLAFPALARINYRLARSASRPSFMKAIETWDGYPPENTTV